MHFQIEIGETSSSLRTFNQNQTQEMSKIRIKYIESCSIVLEHLGNTPGNALGNALGTLWGGRGKRVPPNNVAVDVSVSVSGIFK